MNFPFASVLHHASPQKLHPIRPRALAAAVLLLALVSPPGFAQQNNDTRPPVLPASEGSGDLPIMGSRQQQDPTMHRMMERMALKRDNARQKQIVTDSAKLLKLAKQLNADVAKSNVNTLSVPVVKEAAEIEKLAKTIKERMSDGY